MSSTVRSVPIPLVRDINRCESKGILTARQHEWVSSATNDFKTENPVVYRHEVQEKANAKKVSETEAEAFNVRGLPTDLSDNVKSSTGLIEKIQENRRERHESTYEDMVQELAAINLELEPQIAEVCQTVKTYLDFDLKEMKEDFSRLDDDKVLVTLTMEELEQSWASIEEHSPRRIGWIEELNGAIEDIEKNKALLIQEVFKAYRVALENIAHLMPADVQRLIEDEVMEVNLSLLKNKKSVADLIARLMLVDVETQKQFFIKWKNRVSDWKSLKLKIAIKKQEEFMSSDSVTDSPILQHLLKELVAKQKNINKRRLELLEQLKGMKPPISTKTAVYQWNCALTNMTDDLDRVNLGFICDIKEEQEKILNECMKYVNKTKHQLLSERVISEDIIDEFFEETFLPLVGERKAAFDYHCEKLEKHINEVSAEQKEHFKYLLKYTQGIAHQWDIHEIGLTKEERHLQELLDKNRREHDYYNQIKEAKLDIVMDRMRQDSTEEALNGSLHQSFMMLDDIKKGYLEFHKQQQGICEKYPKMISEELKRYTSAVRRYFNAIQRSKQNVDDERKGQRALYTIRLSDNETVYDIMEAPSETPSTEASGRSTQLSTKTFFTDLDDVVEKEKLPYVESFAIDGVLFTDLRKIICEEFLEHLRTWNKEAHDKAESIMMAKIEETNNELDLRLHLHNPRSGRAENDVHNVRLAELSLHRERVEHHCSGVHDSLETLKRSFQEMLQNHLKENEKYRKSIEELESSFAAAANTHELKTMQSEVNGKLEKFMDVIRASVRSFRFHLDEVLNKLRSSNAQFRKSLKIFSEGGNFSPDEVEEFRKRLEKVATRIDVCEGNVSGDLEGLETKRMDVAKEYAGKLEDRFKYHLFDLTFIEKMKRWLTNIQVKIKAEVANSNSQSQQLSKMVSAFHLKLNTIQTDRNNEKHSIEEAHQTLLPIIQSFRDRAAYLNCALKKEFPSIDMSRDSLTKTPIEKIREKAGSRSSRSRKTSKRLSAKMKAAQNVVQAVQQRVNSPTNDGHNTEEIVPNIPQIPKPPTGYGMRRNSGIRTALGGKYDKKYLVFGDSAQEPIEPEQHFLVLQKKILQTGLDGLLTTAELYYRQKGQRPSTRNQVINDTFDACADSLIQRLRKYKKQTETYHNDCIQEFRGQVKLFNEHLKELPSLLIMSMVAKHHSMSLKAQEEIEMTLKQKLQYCEKTKKEHQTLLRPTLAHPNNRPELDKLKASEQSRQIELEKVVNDYERLMKECENLSAKSFLKDLIDMVSLLLSQFDTALTLNEIIIGESKPKAKTEKELLLGKHIKEKENKIEIDEKQTNSPYNWSDLDLQLFRKERLISELDFLSQAVSIKNTDAHKSIIEARDNEFEKFCRLRSKKLEKLNVTCQQLRNEHQRWQKNWNTSLDKITQLY